MRLVAVVVCLLPAWAAELELRGRIEPAPEVRAGAVIYGAGTPYAATTLADAKGRFRFRKLAAGTYTLSVFVPGQGEVHRTVEVSPSLADSRGVVKVTIPLGSLSARELKQRHATSVRDLAIPESARREFAQAGRDLARPDAAAAARHLERAVEIAPGFTAAWNLLGTLAYQTGKHLEAEKYFRRALEAEPGAYSPTVNLGGVLINLKRYEEALQYNEYAVLHKPDDPLAHSQLGMNYFLLGRQDAALEHLRTAKRLDPAHFSLPQLVLAEIYLRRGDRSAALRELQEYVALHPDAENAGRVREQIRKLKLR